MNNQFQFLMWFAWGFGAAVGQILILNILVNTINFFKAVMLARSIRRNNALYEQRNPLLTQIQTGYTPDYQEFLIRECSMDVTTCSGIGNRCNDENSRPN